MTAIRFDDGDAYEDFMSPWTRRVGTEFIAWLAPAPGLHWLDVGCGNGAFTGLLLEAARAAAVDGIDPSAEQIAFARARLAGRPAALRAGDAMALPWPEARFDAATMALVLFFVPEPARGVAEMVRVVRPGGSVSAYVWDFLAGGFPYAVVHQEMQALGMAPLWPPHPGVAAPDALRRSWTDAGLVDVAVRPIEVTRRFADFESFWRTARKGPGMTTRVDEMPDARRAELRARVQARCAADAGGVVVTGVANAVRGRRPA